MKVITLETKLGKGLETLDFEFVVQHPDEIVPLLKEAYLAVGPKKCLTNGLLDLIYGLSMTEVEVGRPYVDFRKVADGELMSGRGDPEHIQAWYKKWQPDDLKYFPFSEI